MKKIFRSVTKNGKTYDIGGVSGESIDINHIEDGYVTIDDKKVLTKDNWIKEFDEKFGVIKTDDEPGLPSVEIFMSEDQDVEEIKDFISQVEKDAIEKTNKGWRDRIKDVVTSCGLMIYGDTQWTDLIKEKLSDLLEEKK